MTNHLHQSNGASSLSRSRGVHALVGLLAAIVIAVAGCSGGGSAGDSGGAAAGQGTTSTRQPAATCQPNGTRLRITAQDNLFDQQCLAGPAGTALVITLDNKDQGVVHNLAIYSDPQRTRTLFKGELVQGAATVAYHLPALPPGSYFFQCDVHPQTMTGTFVVR